EGERPQVVVDAPADAWRAVGVVAGHRGSRQGQRRSGVVVSAAAQAGPAAAAVGLVVGQEAAIHRRRGREHVSDAAARAETGEDSSGAAGRVTLAAAGLPVAQLAAADVGRASEIPYASAHPGPDQGRGAGGAGVVVAAEGIVVVQSAVADRSGGGTSIDTAPQARGGHGRSAPTPLAVSPPRLIRLERPTANLPP